MVYYLDSSAWVKRYFAEAGSSWVHALFKREIALAGTALSYIEVAATVARRTRPGSPLPALQQQLLADWKKLLQVEMTESVYDRAHAIAWNQKLRGADAIHLAAAQQLQQQVALRSLDLVLVTADHELMRAAKQIQIDVTNPAEIT